VVADFLFLAGTSVCFAFRKNCRNGEFFSGLGWSGPAKIIMGSTLENRSSYSDDGDLRCLQAVLPGLSPFWRRGSLLDYLFVSSHLAGVAS
jgi:hypothetical protein